MGSMLPNIVARSFEHSELCISTFSLSNHEISRYRAANDVNVCSMNSSILQDVSKSSLTIIGCDLVSCRRPVGVCAELSDNRRLIAGIAICDEPDGVERRRHARYPAPPRPVVLQAARG
jgi:hypothetical protein